MRAEWAIEAVGLVKYYGTILAISGVDLRVRLGEFLTIFGPNGAGKTTLIKILATLLKPTAGKVRLNGREITGDREALRREIGFISHHTLLYGGLTAHENLKFYGKMYGVPNLKDRIEEVIKEVGLTERLHSQVRTLSRGMQQRLTLARAILHDPSILLFDEPYTGLDPTALRIFGELVGRLHDGSRAIIMTTHNISSGLEGCSRVAIQVGGKITFDKPRSVIDPATFEAVYFHHVQGGTPC